MLDRNTGIAFPIKDTKMETLWKPPPLIPRNEFDETILSEWSKSVCDEKAQFVLLALFIVGAPVVGSIFPLPSPLFLPFDLEGALDGYGLGKVSGEED
jgi:hypothetical protein